MKYFTRLFVLCLVLFIVFTVWVGVDRHERQKTVLYLEQQRDYLLLERYLASRRVPKQPCRDFIFIIPKEGESDVKVHTR